jgi:hypothetical protein
MAENGEYVGELVGPTPQRELVEAVDHDKQVTFQLTGGRQCRQRMPQRPLERGERIRCVEHGHSDLRRPVGVESGGGVAPPRGWSR